MTGEPQFPEAPEAPLAGTGSEVERPEETKETIEMLEHCVQSRAKALGKKRSRRSDGPEVEVEKEAFLGSFLHLDGTSATSGNSATSGTSVTSVTSGNLAKRDQEKPLRQVRSQPSLGGRSHAASARSLKGRFHPVSSLPGQMQHQQQQQHHQQQHHQQQPPPPKDRKSPLEEKQVTRQPSPGAGGNGATGALVAAEEDEEEDGLHDTITSLAGAKMMQWYHKALTGSRKNSNVSLNQHRLEDLFLIEEDVKHEDAFEDDSDLGPSMDVQGIQEETYVEETDVFVPPDGGYGWFVALGAFIALMWTSGTVKSYGVIFESILEEFPDTSVSLASWIPASLTTLALAMAPVASALCSRYNCRSVTFAGGLFCALGICLSGFATCVEHLFFTFGLLTGIGVGLSTTPGIILVARYFNKKRGMANAFCLSGTATGSFFIPFLIEYLLDEYGFRNALLLLGGCMLHLFISGALYRPLRVHVIITRNARKKIEKLNPKIQIESQPTLRPNLSHSHFRHNVSHPHMLHHYHHHNHHLHQHHPQQQPFLSRQVSDPHEVVSRLQNRLKLMASAETISLSSDRGSEGPEHFHNSQTDLQSPPMSPHVGINQEQVHPRDKVVHQISAQMSTLPNSSLASHEDLQCHWSDSRPSINDLITPRTHGDGNQVGLPQINECCLQNYLDTPVPSKAKALSLRELYIHQLGNRINSFSNSIFGDQSRAMSRKRSAPPRRTTGNDSPPLFRNVESFVSVKSAFNNKGDEEQMTKKNRNTSFIFTFEDFMTDSTCIFKDTRYPTVNLRRDSDVHSGNQSEIECEPGRIVSLGRSVSVLSKRGHDEQLRRQRYISDGLSSVGGSVFDVSTNRFQTPPPSRVSSFSSAMSYSRGRKESGLMMSVGLENMKKDPSIINERDEEEDLVDDATTETSHVHPVLSCFQCIGRTLGISLCSDPRFVIVVVSVMSMSVGVPHVLFFLPSYSHSLHVGIDPATLLAVISIFDLLGRVMMGLFVDANLVPKFVAYAGLIFMSAVSIIALPFFKDVPSIFILCSFYGLGVGGWFLMVPLLLADFFGVERIGASYGLARLFQSLSNLMGPIVAGLIRDQTGSFKGAYFFMGAVMMIGCPVVLLSPLAEKRVSKSNEDFEK